MNAAKKSERSRGTEAHVKRYLDSRASDSHERWLVSYADFITLLFAFFVVMYAVSSVNEGKYRVLGDAIGTAFRIGGPAVPASQLGTIRPNLWARRERAAATNRSVAAAVAPLAGQGQMRVLSHARGTTVEIGAGVLFAPGQAALRQESLQVLNALAQALRAGEQPVEIEGHTDDTPIRTAQFPSNWELSAARAGSVARALAEGGVAPARLAAIGYGEFRPVDSNATEEGRARNRRVSVTVVDPEPGAESGAESRGRSFPSMEFPVTGR
ncbi:MAG TPA: OmpA family protein [Burkholderiales bacterium]|nr:OmpA family protein [Burkholderiales bacterium]